ncbi:hypothetical protein AAG906_019418 [Vitis piasezkii]
MGIKMFDGDSFHSEKNKKSILVDDSFMIQPQSIVDDQSNSHFGTDISMVADIAGVTQPQKLDDLYMVIDWDSAAEHVMTSWTLEMDYRPSDIETTGCIDDELASNGKSIGSTNSGASKGKFLLKKQADLKLSGVYKGILLVARYTCTPILFVKIFNESEKDLEVLMED